MKDGTTQETITNLRAEVQELHKKIESRDRRIDSFKQDVAMNETAWSEIVSCLSRNELFSEIIETMVSDAVDCKIDNLNLSDEIADEVESFLGASTITIDRY